MEYKIETIQGKQFKVYPNGRRTPHGGNTAFVRKTGLSAAQMIKHNAKDSKANAFDFPKQSKPTIKPVAPEAPMAEDKETTND